ncbi:hypothetical protein evm_011192 [Chilo suppressalis]|nr:hypothetical protein evm_011192 [Chilo suppressalis]
MHRVFLFKTINSLSMARLVLAFSLLEEARRVDVRQRRRQRQIARYRAIAQDNFRFWLLSLFMQQEVTNVLWEDPIVLPCHNSQYLNALERENSIRNINFLV